MSIIIGTFAGVATARTESYLIMVERSGSVAPRTTRRSIKNITFNLARHVSGAYTRFHNHVPARLRWCVHARCRFHDATPVTSLLFPGSSINWSGKRFHLAKEGERERARIAYHPRTSASSRCVYVVFTCGPRLFFRANHCLARKAFFREFR